MVKESKRAKTERGRRDSGGAVPQKGRRGMLEHPKVGVCPRKRQQSESQSSWVRASQYGLAEPDARLPWPPLQAATPALRGVHLHAAANEAGMLLDQQGKQRRATAGGGQSSRGKERPAPWDAAEA